MIRFEFGAPANPKTGPVIFRFGTLAVLSLVAAQMLAPPQQVVEISPVPLR